METVRIRYYADCLSHFLDLNKVKHYFISSVLCAMQIIYLVPTKFSLTPPSPRKSVFLSDRVVDNTNIMIKISLQLFNSFQQGNPEALVTIMDKLQPRVFGFTKKIVRSIPDAEELTQDVFIKLWDSRRHVKSKEQLPSYVYAMAKNLAYDFMRKHKLTFVEYENLSVVHSIVPDVESEYKAKELDLLITLEVEKMTPQRRRVFQMSVREGLSHDEIAKKLRITNKTVSNHLYYVMDKLENSFLLTISVVLIFASFIHQ